MTNPIRRRSLQLFFALTAFFSAGLALAQEASAAAGDAPPVKSILDAMQGGKGNGWILTGAVVSLATWALRKGILNRLPWPAAVTYLHDHPAIGMATPIVLAGIANAIAPYAAGVPFTWSGFIEGTLKVGIAAIGTFVGMKTVTESHDFANEAAAKLTTVAAANVELLKPTDGTAPTPKPAALVP